MWQLEDFWTCWISTKSLTHFHKWREEEGAQNWIVNVENDYFSHLLLCGLQAHNFCRRNTVLLPSGRSHGLPEVWQVLDAQNGQNAHGITHQQRNHHWLSPSYQEHIPLGRPASSVATSPEWKCWHLGWVWKRGIGRHELNSSALIPVLNSDTPEEIVHFGEVGDHDMIATWNLVVPLMPPLVLQSSYP